MEGRPGEACASHGWRIHALVLMGNYFHLLVEMPEANLVSRMKWLLGTFSQGSNRVRLCQGHLFRLNPVRAGFAGGGGDRGAAGDGGGGFGEPFDGAGKLDKELNRELAAVEKMLECEG